MCLVFYLVKEVCTCILILKLVLGWLKPKQDNNQFATKDACNYYYGIVQPLFLNPCQQEVAFTAFICGPIIIVRPCFQKPTYTKQNQIIRYFFYSLFKLLSVKRPILLLPYKKCLPASMFLNSEPKYACHFLSGKRSIEKMPHTSKLTHNSHLFYHQ